jgi:hypothetical protein
MRHELKKWAHLAAWLTVGLLAYLGVAALCGCSAMARWVGSGQADEDIARGTTIAQGAATLLGAPWAIPIIGAAGTALAGVLHAQVGIPGLKAIPGTRAHRKRAVKQVQRDAVKANVPV